MPRLLIDGIVFEAARTLFEKPNLSRNDIEQQYLGLMACMVYCGEACLKWPMQAQLDLAQRLGQSLRGAGTTYDGTLSEDTRACIDANMHPSRMAMGFTPTAYRDRNYNDRNKNRDRNNNRGGVKRRRVCSDSDRALMQDPSSDKFVPEGFCRQHHRLGGCPRGENCRWSHKKWTDEQLAAAKKKAGL